MGKDNFKFLLDSDLEDDEFIVDDGTTPDDEAFAKLCIKEKIVEAEEIIDSLKDYLTFSDYAVNKGGDLFKHYLDKSNIIYEQLRHFFDN